MPRKKWLSLALVSFLSLTARPATAQDSLYEPTEPAAVFSGGAEYLIMSRDHNFDGPANFLNGPDAGAINFNNTDFDFESGFRGFLALSNQGIRIEGVYTDFGRWSYQRLDRRQLHRSYDGILVSSCRSGRRNGWRC
jgi:hypothetical protein